MSNRDALAEMGQRLLLAEKEIRNLHGELVREKGRMVLAEKVLDEIRDDHETNHVDSTDGEEIKAPGPKFKKEQTVRIIAETEHENYIGVITGSEAIEGGEWRYGVQLPTVLLQHCHPDELETVEDSGSGEEVEA